MCDLIQIYFLHNLSQKTVTRTINGEVYILVFQRILFDLLQGIISAFTRNNGRRVSRLLEFVIIRIILFLNFKNINTVMGVTPEYNTV
jgi:hypothetical protein